MLSFSLRRLFVLPPILIVLMTPAVADPWYEHYQNGEQALKAQNWQEAAQEFNDAINKRGQPGVKLRTYGMNFINYHPYLKLGIAYYNMGRFDAALRAFDTEDGYDAIARSFELQNLQTLRRLTEEGKRAAASTQKEQIAKAIKRSLQEAAVLERQGRLDEAMAAVGEGLSLDPHDTEALNKMDRLRSLVAEGERLRDVEAQLSALVQDGRRLLGADDYAGASAKFNQALSLKSGDATARSLLDQAQQNLREESQQAAGAESRQALVSTALADASGFEEAGRLSEAVQSLQAALAVDPGNQQVHTMHDRLVKAQTDANLLDARTKEIARLLGEGVSLLKNAEPARSIATFNRVLALDPSNASVRTYISQAYTALNTVILSRGVPVVTRTPPAILISTPGDSSLKEAGNNVVGEQTGSTAELAPRIDQRVSTPDFTLYGLIIDDQPEVRVTFLTIPASGDSSEARESPEEILAGRKEGLIYQFRFSREFILDPGVAALKVAVTDLDGLTAEVTYAVAYAPPIWRRWWFYPILAGGLVIFLVIAQAVRVVRRNRLLRRRFNPYVAGAPVTQDDLFVGREALLSRILQTIHNNSILLYGERRIGKTTVQHHLKKRLQQVQDPDYEFYPVFIDLQGTPEEQFFATLADDVFTELSPILSEASLKSKARDGQPYDYTQFIREIRNVLWVLQTRSSKKIKLVLLIDEVDELNNYDPRVNQRLRSLFMKSFAEDLVAVVSGVAIKKRWESEGSPWYNFFEEIEVKPFTRKDAEDLIERPIQGIFKIEEGAVDLILNNTECKPYLIQKICVSLVNQLHAEKRRKITVADVEAIGRPVEV